MLARITPFFLFAAFVLMLLVSLSAPIIKPIYLFRLAVESAGGFGSASGAVQFGVFGYCVTDIEVSVLGFSGDSDGECSSKRLGYRIDDTVASVLGASDINDSISRATTTAFVLNPIAAGLAFLAFLLSLAMLRKSTSYGRHSSAVETTKTSRLASFFTFGLGLLAALATTAAFLINIIGVVIIRNRINDSADNVGLDWGNAVWMTLGAAVALWIGVFGAMWGVCCGGRSSKRARY